MPDRIQDTGIAGGTRGGDRGGREREQHDCGDCKADG
jgi:hypothetical protein